MSKQERARIQNPIPIPEPTNNVDALWRTCQALKEAVEVMQGARGNREVALKADLTQLGDNIITSVVSAPGGGGGVDTFFDLTDTNLATQAANHLVFNFDGTNWWNTGDNFRWFPTGGIAGDADSSIRLGYDTTLDFEGNNLVEASDVTIIKYNNAQVEIGPEIWSGGSLDRSDRMNLKGQTIYIQLHDGGVGDVFENRARFTRATSNELGVLDLKDRDDVYRPVGYGAMKTVTVNTGSDTILQQWWHCRVECTTTTTLSLSDITHGSMPDGSVMWIVANGGDVTVQPTNNAILSKFLGIGVTTGAATVADGGWATLVKIGGFASDDFHITGVGVS